MTPSCTSCALPFAREPGFYLGSIYFNYGLTALLITTGYFAAFFGEWLAPRTLLATLAAFAVVFPLWFFRYARSLWLGFDYFVDPPAAKE